jgi:hypothetical protein
MLINDNRDSTVVMDFHFPLISQIFAEGSFWSALISVICGKFFNVFTVLHPFLSYPQLYLSYYSEAS